MKYLFLILILIGINGNLYSQCNFFTKYKIQKEYKKYYKKKDKSTVPFFVKKSSVLPIKCKCYLPVNYVVQRVISDTLLNKPFLNKTQPEIDSIMKIKKLDNEINSTTKTKEAKITLIKDKYKLLEKSLIDSAQRVAYLKETNKYRKSIYWLDSIYGKSESTIQNNLLRKYDFCESNIGELKNKLTIDSLKFVDINNKKTLIKSHLDSLLSSISNHDSIALLNKYLRQQKYFQSDSLFNKLQDEILRMPLASKDGLPSSYTFSRAGKHGEDLMVKWTTPLDTNFAFNLGDYNTEPINKNIAVFARYVGDKSKYRNLNVDLTFLGVADANSVTSNFKYEKLLLDKIEKIDGYFRVGINSEPKDTIHLTIKQGKELTNAELALLRSYNAYVITKQYLSEATNEIRYIHEDAISFEGNEAKKGALFRRVQIIAYIYEFFLIDGENNPILIDNFKEYNLNAEKKSSNTIIR